MVGSGLGWLHAARVCLACIGLARLAVGASLAKCAWRATSAGRPSTAGVCDVGVVCAVVWKTAVSRLYVTRWVVSKSGGSPAVYQAPKGLKPTYDWSWLSKSHLLQ